MEMQLLRNLVLFGSHELLLMFFSACGEGDLAALYKDRQTVVASASAVSMVDQYSHISNKQSRLGLSGLSVLDAANSVYWPRTDHQVAQADSKLRIFAGQKGLALAAGSQEQSALRSPTVSHLKTVPIWIGHDELRGLKMEGEAWLQLKARAKQPAGTPNLSDPRQKNNVYVLAKALVYARCSLETEHDQCRDISVDGLRNEVIDQVMRAIGTEGNSTLALGRELAAYVISADLLGLPVAMDLKFRDWLANVRHKNIRGRTLISTHEDRPNNWGTHAGASRVAVAVYLNDIEDLHRAAKVFKGYLGDRMSYAGFRYGKDLSWQCSPDKPVGINPAGCARQGHSIDGVLPDDQRRCGSFGWPACLTNYAWEGLQGAIVQAVILNRAGYDVFTWNNRALLRAYKWLYIEGGNPAKGDDSWQLALVDRFYGTNFWDGRKTRPGKNIGWTDWTHPPTN